MKTSHAALPQPEMSRRRKISLMAMIATQIYRTHAKMMRMSQRTFKKGYDEALISNGLASSHSVEAPLCLRRRGPCTTAAAAASPRSNESDRPDEPGLVRIEPRSLAGYQRGQRGRPPGK